MAGTSRSSSKAGADRAAQIALLSDPDWRLRNLYWIKNKAGERQLFKPNWAQERCFDTLAHNNLELKVRQLGITTGYCIRWLDLCLFNPDVAVGIIAHTKEDAMVIFRDKIAFPYDNLPPDLQGARTTTTKKITEQKSASERLRGHEYCNLASKPYPYGTPDRKWYAEHHMNPSMVIMQW